MRHRDERLQRLGGLALGQRRSCCLQAGGQVVGESNDNASLPRNDAITPDDAAASFYHAMGIDSAKEYESGTGRPITLVRDGKVIEQLFA